MQNITRKFKVLLKKNFLNLVKMSILKEVKIECAEVCFQDQTRFFQ